MCSLLTPGETVLICAATAFCYCFNFMITFIVYEWEWASCQPQCPLSQFHCPCCGHMGASWHLSTLFGTSRTKNPLWWTAQSRSDSSSKPPPPRRERVLAVNMHVLNQLTRLVPIMMHVVSLPTNILASSTPVWLRKAKVFACCRDGLDFQVQDSRWGKGTWCV